MGDISENFSRSEFKCHCPEDCGFEAVDKELVEILEKIRDEFGKPIYLNCACRCLRHNRDIGSRDNSQHVKGMAADIRVDDKDPEDIIFWVDNNILKDRGGLGVYDNFCHIDVRDKKSRWDERS